MRKYYFDPRLKGYYQSLKKLANLAGDISEKQALYDDVMAEVPLSPGQERTYSNYYAENANFLASRISECKAELKAAWRNFKLKSEIVGVPISDEETRRKFYYALIAREADCDFRSWFHRRLNVINRRIEKGLEIFSPDDYLIEDSGWTELKVVTIADFLNLYDKLCKKRRGLEK